MSTPNPPRRKGPSGPPVKPSPAPSGAIKKVGWASPAATVNYDFNYSGGLLSAPSADPVALTLPLDGIVAGDVIEYAWDLYVENTSIENFGLASCWGQAQWDGAGTLYTLKGSLGSLFQDSGISGSGGVVRFNMHGRWAHRLTDAELAGRTTLVVTPQFACVATLNVPAEGPPSGIQGGDGVSNQFRVIVYSADVVFQANQNNTFEALP